MILASLRKYGELLVERGLLPSSGWSRVKVSYALQINSEGEVIGVSDLRQTVVIKEKEVLVSTMMNVPYKTKHTNGDSPFFLCENVLYFFGISDKRGAEKKKASCAKLHQTVLAGVDTEKAIAVQKFFTANDDLTEESEVFAAYPDALDSSNLVLVYEDGTFLHEDDDIRKAWDDYYSANLNESLGPIGTDILTGESGKVMARTHQQITGIKGALGTGAALVSFNFPTAKYRDYESSLNAHTSWESAELYGAALKYLFESSRHHYYINGDHYLYWTEDPTEDDDVSTAFSMTAFGRQEMTFDADADDVLYQTVVSMLNGKVEDRSMETMSMLDCNINLLVLRPHMSRLAVIDFQTGSLGRVVENVKRFTEESEITINTKEGPNTFSLSLSRLRNALAGEKVKPGAFPTIEKDVVRSVLYGDPYPPAMLRVMLNRIQTDRKMSTGGAQVIRAYLRRNGKRAGQTSIAQRDGEIAMTKAYKMGQLFSTLCSLQRRAMDNIGRDFTTLYMRAVTTRPADAFARMLTQSEVYKKKLMRDKETRGLAFWYDRTIKGYIEEIGGPFPTTLTTTEQGEFMLGYYTGNNIKTTKENNENEQGSNQEQV